jgi:hypothetical protein
MRKRRNEKKEEMRKRRNEKIEVMRKKKNSTCKHGRRINSPSTPPQKLSQLRILEQKVCNF